MDDPLIGLAKNSTFWCDLERVATDGSVSEVGQLQLLHVRAGSQVVLARSMSLVTSLVGSQRCGRILIAKDCCPVMF